MWRDAAVKMLLCIVLTLGILITVTGCGGESVDQTQEHCCGQQQGVSAPQYDISLPTPANAPEIETFSGEHCRIFAQEDGDYYITVQTLQAESLDALLLEIAGKSRESMTVMTTWQGNVPRHDLNWISAGERGLEINRAVILDDGSHYYTVILTVPEEKAGQIGQQVEDCFSAIRLTENQEDSITVP